jgi:hypothetical protein
MAAQHSTVNQCVDEGIRIECPRSRAKSAFEHGMNPRGHREQMTPEQDREQQILDWIKQTPNTSRQLREKKSRIIARVNFKFQSFTAG